MTSKASLLYQSLLEDYPDALQPITELSRNTSAKKDFVICEHRAFNFDLIRNLCISNVVHKEKSPDALFLHKDILYFIEFKEGKAEKEDIRLKIHEAVVTLYHYAKSKGLAEKQDFFSLDIRYAVVMRNKIAGRPDASFLDTLERTTLFFNLKNLEGLLISKTKVVFQPKSIFKLLNDVSNKAISQICIKSNDQTSSEVAP